MIEFLKPTKKKILTFLGLIVLLFILNTGVNLTVDFREQLDMQVFGITSEPTGSYSISPDQTEFPNRYFFTLELRDIFLSIIMFPYWQLLDIICSSQNTDFCINFSWIATLAMLIVYYLLAAFIAQKHNQRKQV